MITVIGQALAWWVGTTVAALAAAPIARALMPTLPDRGLAFARPLGLLLVGYTWWLLVTAGVLPNSRLGALIALALVAAGGVALVAGDPGAWWREIRARRRLIIGLETLYLVALVLWAIYRAFYPDVTESGGEKMMEMSFLSAIQKSPSFPPNDPWLSGHSISYYYFGYVIAAWLIQLTGISRFVAYNLVVPMTLGMTLAAAFGLGWSLAALTPGTTRRLRIAAGAVTATLLALAGNLAGFLELAFMRGWLPRAFFDWLNVRNLTIAADGCGEPGSGYGLGGVFPSRFMWWWRTSRIISDRAPDGACRDVIHEFPFFSFLLADVHPHVMALPYVLLALGIGLAILRGAAGRWPGARYFGPVWLLVPLCVGALGFLNTWDLPTYGLVVGLCFVLWRLGPAGRRTNGPLEIAEFGVWLLALAIAAYLPFYSAFRSQAAGIGVARFSSRLAQWSVHFLPLAFLSATVIVLALVRGAPRGRAVAAVAAAAAAAIAVLWSRVLPHYAELGATTNWTSPTPALALALLAMAIVALVHTWPWPRRRSAADRAGVRIEPSLDAAPAGAEPTEVDDAASGERAVTVSRAVEEPVEEPIDEPVADGQVALTFALVCVCVGLLMAAVPEFIYLKDVFNDRMNTVFKFFFQAWVLLSIGGGYALTAVLAGRHSPDRQRQRPSRWMVRPAAPWMAVFGVLAVMVLYTPVAAVFNRTDGLRWTTLRGGGLAAWSGSLNLDGIRYWEQQNPDDLAAARWLDAHALGTPNILEAAGGGYDRAGRIAMITGFPTVLGADNHESQWQGTREDIDPRLADVEAFYTRMPAPEMADMLRRYDVRYVIVGGRERDKYPELAADLDDRLTTFMSPAFRSGQTTVWSVNAPSQ